MKTPCLFVQSINTYQAPTVLGVLASMVPTFMSSQAGGEIPNERCADICEGQNRGARGPYNTGECLMWAGERGRLFCSSGIASNTHGVGSSLFYGGWLTGRWIKGRNLKVWYGEWATTGQAELAQGNGWSSWTSATFSCWTPVCLLLLKAFQFFPGNHLSPTLAPTVWVQLTQSHFRGYDDWFRGGYLTQLIQWGSVARLWLNP